MSVGGFVYEVNILLHTLVALFAVFIGIFLLTQRKGDSSHRRIGHVWIVLMVLVLLSSLFIREIHAGQWSVLHIGTIVAAFLLALAFIAARLQRRLLHAVSVCVLYGILLIVGVFALMPGRYLPALV